MGLSESGLGLAATIAIIIFFSRADKKSGTDNNRLWISIAGIMCMMFLFFFLANLLVVSGVLR